MPQHRKEAIDDGARSKLDRRLVSTPLRICEFLAVEVEQWLNRKPCSSSTNAENVAARYGGGGIRKRHLLRQYFSAPSANIALEMVGNDGLLAN